MMDEFPDFTRADLEALLEALATSDEPPSPSLRMRVLARVARLRLPPEILTVRHLDSDWQPFLPGVQSRTLHDDGTTRTWLARVEPETYIPAHTHEQDEECLVLEGSVVLNDVTLGAGDYQIARAGSRHDLVYSATGCLALMRSASACTPLAPVLAA